MRHFETMKIKTLYEGESAVLIDLFGQIELVEGPKRVSFTKISFKRIKLIRFKQNYFEGVLILEKIRKIRQVHSQRQSIFGSKIH